VEVARAFLGLWEGLLVNVHALLWTLSHMLQAISNANPLPNPWHRDGSIHKFPSAISSWQYLGAGGERSPEELPTDGHLQFPINGNPQATECSLHCHHACCLQTESWNNKTRSYWLLLRDDTVQSVSCTATIFWAIVHPHLISNHSWFIQQISLENTKTTNH
jgi:hypothetical protein